MQDKPSRLAGFDDLRLAVIALVVLVHANVTYSGIGSWYYLENSPSSLDPVALVLMALLGMFLQAWFMGVLFFASGLMAVGSRDRRGRAGFVADRAIRLLGPFFLFVLVINPLMLWAFHPAWLSAHPVSILSGSGPLWFTGALFVFSAVWALVPQRPAAQESPVDPAWTKPWVWAVVAGAIGLGAWAIRIPFPVGTSVLNMQLCFFVSYAVLFTAGTFVGRPGRLDGLPASWARLVWVTPLVSLPLLLGLLVASGALDGNRSFLGGGTLPSLGYAVWEGATAVAMTLGLVVRARDRSRLARVSAPGQIRRLLRANSFGIYVLHAPVLWGLGLALASVSVWAPVKAVGAAVVTLALTLGVSWVLRKVPGLGRLLT